MQRYLILCLILSSFHYLKSDDPVTSTEKSLQVKLPQIKVKTREWGTEFSKLEALFDRATLDRQELNDLRQRNMEKYLKIRDTKNPNFIRLAHTITEETIQYLEKRITQTVHELGTPPTDFCIFTMGSMARQESGFYTDLEIGVLVKEKNIRVIQYFQRLAQKLADRFFLLGEHPDVGGKGFRMDEADNSPAHLHFFARYACEEQAKSLLKSALEKREFDKIPYEGSRIFIATPAEFAQHVKPHFLTKEVILSKEDREKIFHEELNKEKKDPKNKEKTKEDLSEQVKSLVDALTKPLTPREKQISTSASMLVRNIRFLYGDKRLFNEYLKEREVYLRGKPMYHNPVYKTRRQEIAFLAMKSDVLKYAGKPGSSIAAGKLDKTVDIKRELYRFPEQMLTDLGFFYHLPVQNTAQIAQLLAKRGLISQESGDALSRTMNYLLGLRFKKQEMCRKQTYAFATTLEEYNDQVKDLETELANLDNQKTILVQTHSLASDIANIDAKISKIRSELIDMKKLKPMEETSILSKDEMDKLNNIYLPILNKLFSAVKSFLAGNQRAFIDMKLVEPSSTAAFPERPVVKEETPSAPMIEKEKQPEQQPAKPTMKEILQKLFAGL